MKKPAKPSISRFVKAGSVRSRAKTRAARANGKLGGRPRKNPSVVFPLNQKPKQEHYE